MHSEAILDAMPDGQRPCSFYLLSAVLVVFVLFLYGPLSAIIILVLPGWPRLPQASSRGYGAFLLGGGQPHRSLYPDQPRYRPDVQPPGLGAHLVILGAGGAPHLDVALRSAPHVRRL